MTTTAKLPKKNRKKEKSAPPAPKEKNLVRALELLRAMGDAGFVLDRGNDLPQEREWPKDW